MHPQKLHNLLSLLNFYHICFNIISCTYYQTPHPLYFCLALPLSTNAHPCTCSTATSAKKPRCRCHRGTGPVSWRLFCWCCCLLAPGWRVDDCGGVTPQRSARLGLGPPPRPTPAPACRPVHAMRPSPRTRHQLHPCRAVASMPLCAAVGCAAPVRVRHWVCLVTTVNFTRMFFEKRISHT